MGVLQNFAYWVWNMNKYPFQFHHQYFHKLHSWNFSAATFFVFWLKNPRPYDKSEFPNLYLDKIILQVGNTIRLRYERNLIVFPMQFDYVGNAIQLRYKIIQLCMDSIALSNII